MGAVLRYVARWLLAASFIVLGFEAGQEPGGRVKAAEAIGLPEPEMMVRLNGYAMAAAGLGVGFGVFRRLSALTLLACLAPTTYAGHPFWREQDPQKRQQQRIHFLKNVSMLGGALLVLLEKK